MKAPNDGLAHLHEVMGGAELTTLNLGEVAARVVAHADARVLDAFWVEYGGDQAAVPSTPAWVGRLPLKTGHLALVSDRVVFFYDTLFNDECRHAFAFPPGSYQASWRKTRGMLTGKTERFRVSFEPPRGVDLKEVSGPVENPGAGDWLELVAGGGGPWLDLLGSASEMASMWRSNRIAKIHCRMWQERLARVEGGDAWPFAPHGAERGSAGGAMDGESLFDSETPTGAKGGHAPKSRSPKKSARAGSSLQEVQLRTNGTGVVRLPPRSTLLLSDWLIEDHTPVSEGDPVATGELRTEGGPVQQVCLTAPADGLLQQRAQPGTVNTARHTLAWVRAS